MKYDDIKNNIIDIETDIEKANISLNKKQREISLKKKDIKSIQSRLEDDIEIEKNKALKQAEKDAVADIEKVLIDIDMDVKTVKERYERDSKNRSDLAFYKKAYEKDYELIDEVAKLNDKVYEVASNSVSERVASIIQSNLEKYEVPAKPLKIQDYRRQIDILNKQLKSLSKPVKFNFPKYIEKFLKVLNPCKDDEGDESKVRNALISYIAICGLISFGIIYYLSPILLVGLFAIGYYNISHSSKIEKIIFHCKVLSDNIEKIKQAIEDNIELNRQHDKIKLDEEFDDIMSQLMKNRNDKELEMQNKLDDVRDSFHFDDSSLKEKYNMNISSKEEEINRLNKDIDDCNNDLLELKKKLTQERINLQKAIQELIANLFTYNGQEVEFKTSYVFDITNNDVRTWEYRPYFNIILHDDDDIAVNFIRLFIAESLSHYKCGTATFDVVDIKYAAANLADLRKIKNDPNDRVRGIVEIYDDSETLDNLQVMLEKEAKSRKKTISEERGCNNIEEFNALMRSPEVKGMPLSYMFVIFYTVDLDVLNSEFMSSILRIGHTLGIFVILFTTMDDLRNSNDTAFRLLNIPCNVSILREDVIKRTSKNSILRNLSSDE